MKRKISLDMDIWIEGEDENMLNEMQGEVVADVEHAANKHMAVTEVEILQCDTEDEDEDDDDEDDEDLDDEDEDDDEDEEDEEEV